MTSPGVDSVLDEHVVSTDDDEGSRYAHWVRSEDWEQGYIEGQVITALCGYRWVPSRNPDRLPICPRCRFVRETLMQGWDAT